MGWSDASRRWKSMNPQTEYGDKYNDKPTNWYSGNSSVVGGRVTLDPNIRKLQDQGLGRSGEMYGRLGLASSDYLSKNLGTKQDLLGLRGRYQGNMAGYTQARVNPILQARERASGELNRQHGLRGISGSSFANQDYSALQTDFAREEGDARALAENENLGALTQNIQMSSDADKAAADNIFQTITMQKGLNQDNFDVAQDQLKQELAGLGLARDQIQQYMDAFENFANRSLERRKAIASTISSTVGGGKGGGGSA